MVYLCLEQCGNVFGRSLPETLPPEQRSCSTFTSLVYSRKVQTAQWECERECGAKMKRATQRAVEEGCLFNGQSLSSPFGFKWRQESNKLLYTCTVCVSTERFYSKPTIMVTVFIDGVFLLDCSWVLTQRGQSQVNVSALLLINT